MRLLYLVSVGLHILAATAWIGGMFFLVLVVVPWLRRGDRPNAGAFLRETGERFSAVGWTCFGVLLATGTFNLWFRGVRFSDLASAEWRSSPIGVSVLSKLTVFALVLAASAWHDFGIGPRASDEIQRDPRSAKAEELRMMASHLGRLNAALALVLVGLAVTIVRGWPW
jgi:putative copper export protein